MYNFLVALFDLISIGGITIDMYFKGGNLPFDKQNLFCLEPDKYQADFFQMHLGGGGVNVAVAAQRSGLSVALIGTIGNNHFRQIILNKIKEKGIASQFCLIQDDYNSLSTVLLNNNGERTIITYKTPDDKLTEDIRNFTLIKQARAVFMGNLPDTPIHQRTQILKLARSHHVKTFLNLGIKDCKRPFREIQAIMLEADVIICNRFELAEILKLPQASLNLNSNLIGEHMPQLLGTIFIVTDGGNGSYRHHHGQIHHQSGTCTVKIVDTTGAGDGYTGTFIAHYLQSEDIREAMQQASKYACQLIARVGPS